MSYINIRSYTWRAVALAFFIGAVLGGAGAIWLWVQPPGGREQMVESMLLHTTLEGKKEIVYVPKEASEKTDVQIEAAKPTVTVRVNGQETKIPTLTEETQKFQKGKLVITEETQLKLEIKTPPPSPFSLGVGWGNNGMAMMASGRLGGGQAGWWLYGDRRTLAGGLQMPVGR